MNNISILTLFSGRERTLEPYLLGLEGLEYPKKNLTLVWYCNSISPLFRSILEILKKKYKSQYKNIQLIFDDEIPESVMAFTGLENKYSDAHGTVIATLYNRAWEYIPKDSDFVFFLEDDVYVPSHSLKRLLFTIGLDDRTGMVSGIIFDRHSPEIFHWNLMFFEKEKETKYDLKDFKGETNKRMRAIAVPISRPWGVRQVHLNTLAVTLAKKKILDRLEKPIFELYPPNRKTYRNIRGADMVLSIKLLELGIPILLDSDVRVLHIDHEGKVH